MNITMLYYGLVALGVIYLHWLLIMIIKYNKEVINDEQDT